MPEMMWKYPQDRPYSQKYLADYLHTARTLVSARAFIEDLKRAERDSGVKVRTLNPVFNWSSPDEAERTA